MATQRYHARQTATETGTDGSLIRDLLTTAGTGSLTTQNVNDTAFQETQRFINGGGTTFLNGSATWAGQINVTALGGTIEGRFRFQRRNSSGVVQSSSAYSALFTTTGVKTLSTTWNPGTWAAGDRLAISVEIRRTGGHGNVSINIGTAGSSYVDAQLAPTAVLVQSAYRFRDHASGYDHALNSTTFGIAENTAWTLAETARRFALRVAIEETAGATASQAYKLQYRIDTTGTGASFGAWTDVHVNSPGSADNLRSAISPVEIVPNSTWADGAATTDVIGGSGTFVAGEGKDTGITTSSISLSSQHTELEWSLWLHRWGSNRVEMVPDGSIIEFRVVNSAGGTLTTYSQTPSLTVALPDGHLGGVFAESPDEVGPFEDSAGNLYGIIEDWSGSALPMMMKSTDGGVTWNAVDNGNGPTSSDLEGAGMCLSSDGTELHIAHFQTGGTDSIVYHRFGMSTASSPDQWLETDTLIDDSAGVGAVLEQFTSIVNLGGDDLRVFYSKHPSALDTVVYRDRISGTWDTADTVVWEPSGVDVVPAYIMRDDTNNITYLMTCYDDATGGQMRGKAVTDAGALTDLFGTSVASTDAGTLIADNSGDSQAHRENGTPPATWYDGGTFMAFVVYVDEANGDRLSGNLLTLGSGGSVGTQRNVSQTEVQRGNGTSRQPVADIVRDPGSGDLYAFYAKDTAGAYIDSEVFYRVSGDDGASWGTENTLADNGWGSRPNWIRTRYLSDANAIGIFTERANPYENDQEVINADAGFTGGFIFFTAIALESSINGTAAITESSDIVAASGDLEVSGTAAITETSDSVAASGSVENDGDAAITESSDVVAATGGVEISGDAAITEDTDVVAASGTVQDPPVDGDAAIVESSDVVAASGDLEISGTAAITESTDVVAATGTNESDATVAITEESDVVAASGSVEISGDIAITETSDIVAGSGGAVASGDIAITEDADTLSASGGVEDDGDIAITEDADTVAATGSVEVSGTAPITESPDVLAAAGGVEDDADVAIVESSDVLAASGGVEISGAIAITESTDILAASGAAVVAGDIAITETPDSLSASGGVEDSGDVAITEDPDTLAASGSVEVSGSGAITESPDVLAAAGDLEISGTGAITETSDQVDGAGSVEITGSVAIVETSDNLIASGSNAVNGNAPITEQSDIVAGVGGVEIDGDIAVTEDVDTLAASGGVEDTGNVAITEDPDTLAASGTVETNATDGDIAITESSDVVAASGTVTVNGDAAITESSDVASGAGSVTVNGDAAITEASDQVAASGGVEISGDIAITEDSDNLFASGSNSVIGMAAITESGDIVSGSGSVEISGDAAIIESGDTVAASGGVEVGGGIAINEQPDLLAAAGTVEVSGNVAITEASDLIAGTGTVESDEVSGSGAIIEDPDGLSATGGVEISGAGAIVESPDNFFGIQYVDIEGDVLILEASDLVTAFGGITGAALAAVQLVKILSSTAEGTTVSSTAEGNVKASSVRGSVIE